MQLEEVKIFLDYVKKRGIVSQNTTNSWCAALAGVSSVLDGNDEKTVEFIMDSCEVIRNRLQNQSTEINCTTIGVYIQRSRLALNNFLEWKKDRVAWEKRQASKSRTETNEFKLKKENQQTKANTKDKTQALASSSFTSKMILPIPIENGEKFEVGLPQSYCVEDLIRVMWGLAIYAEDFDPKVILDRFGKPAVQTYQSRQVKIVPPRIDS